MVTEHDHGATDDADDTATSGATDGARDTARPFGPDRRERQLPRAARVALAIVVAAIVVVVLFTTVFPWVEQRLQNPTLGHATDATPQVSAEAPADLPPAQAGRVPR